MNGARCSAEMCFQMLMYAALTTVNYGRSSNSLLITSEHEIQTSESIEVEIMCRLLCPCTADIDEIGKSFSQSFHSRCRTAIRPWLTVSISFVSWHTKGPASHFILSLHGIHCVALATILLYFSNLLYLKIQFINIVYGAQPVFVLIIIIKPNIHKIVVDVAVAVWHSHHGPSPIHLNMYMRRVPVCVRAR